MTPADLNLTATPKLSTLNRLYRLSGSKIDYQRPKQWNKEKNMFMHYCFHVFKYTDDNSFFGFEFDYNDKLVRKLTHEECINIFKI